MARKKIEWWQWWLLGIGTLLVSVLAYGVQILHEDTQLARESSDRNTRILTLVEQCVVDGRCGPDSPGEDPVEFAIRLINAKLDCLAGPEPEAATFQACVESRMSATTPRGGE